MITFLYIILSILALFTMALMWECGDLLKRNGEYREQQEKWRQCLANRDNEINYYLQKIDILKDALKATKSANIDNNEGD